MKRLFVLALLLSACGADGLVTEQGIDDALFGEPAFAPEISGYLPSEDPEIGVSHQAWRSAEYYGTDGDLVPCYSKTTVSSCYFPKFKQFKYVMDTSNCFNNNVPILAIQAIIDSAQIGALLWNGVGSGVTVSTSSGAQEVLVTCLDIVGISLADGGLDGVQALQVPNLPIGPHGKDVGAARQFPHSFIHLDIQAIWDGYQLCDATPTTPELRVQAKYIGAHEMGHAAGYVHFQSGLMKAGSTCAERSGSFSLTTLGTALGSYSGSAAGLNIVDNNLQTFL